MLNSKEIVKTAVNALEDKKAFDIRVIDISKISVIADYFVIASGSNENQVQAMVDNINEQLFKAGVEIEPKIEGLNTSNWVLLDYKEVIIHVFMEEDRKFYDIERIWRDGKEIDIKDL